MSAGAAVTADGLARTAADAELRNGKQSEEKEDESWVIILSILGAILLISALIAVTMNVSRLIFHAAQDTVGSSDYYDDYGDYYDDSEDYEPSEDDAYYKEIVDDINEDAAYTIDWLTESRWASAGDDTTGYYVTYPELGRRTRTATADYSAHQCRLLSGRLSSIVIPM